MEDVKSTLDGVLKEASNQTKKADNNEKSKSEKIDKEEINKMAEETKQNEVKSKEEMSDNQAAKSVSVREVIRSRIIVDNKRNLIPNRDNIEAEAEKSILDQEFLRREAGDYKKSNLEDLIQSEEEEEDEGKSVQESLIRHTDGYKMGNKIYNMVACKTTTAVLDELKEGKYMAIKYDSQFERTDSETVESNLKNFKPLKIELPMGRKRNQVENGMVVIETDVNGFSISALYEDLDDYSHTKLEELLEWVDEYKATILEHTVRNLKEEGADPLQIIRAQAAVGLVPKARRRYMRSLMEADQIDHITKDIVERSREFANKLNEQLALLPLTGQTVTFGFKVYTIEVTTKSAESMGWISNRNGVSYFKKGNVNGRIVRLVGNESKVPIFSRDVADVAGKLREFLPCVLTTLENMVRSQLGYNEKVDAPVLPSIPVRMHNNAAEVLEIERAEVRRIENELSETANKMIKTDAKKETIEHVSNLLMQLGLGGK